MIPEGGVNAVKTKLAVLLLFPLLFLAVAGPLYAQTAADPALAAAINGIRLVDHHAHPLVVLPWGEKDGGWEELGMGSEGGSGSDMGLIPYRLNPGSPDLLRTWRGLWSYRHDTMDKEKALELIETKKRIMREQGDHYPSWVLDRAGIDVMFANRRIMGRGLPASRFHWVGYVDMLMYPLGSERLKMENPSLKGSYASLDLALKESLAGIRVDVLPESLDGYLAKVVVPVLEKQKRDGAVAVKFLLAYLRPLDVADPPAAEARKVYARYAKGGNPSPGEYRTLQDFLFRRICREAGRIGLVVHIHTGYGIGGYFDMAGSNPILLEPVFNDPALRGTRFVIIHGGWPFTRETAALLLKPNVYADFSAMSFLFYPRFLSEVIRGWLEVQPQKVMFGTDAFYVGMTIVNWEEFAWLGADSSRKALALALTGMMNDGEITREKAVELARMVLRENAIRLYNLKMP